MLAFFERNSVWGNFISYSTGSILPWLQLQARLALRELLDRALLRCLHVTHCCWETKILNWGLSSSSLESVLLICWLQCIHSSVLFCLTNTSENDLGLDITFLGGIFKGKNLTQMCIRISENKMIKT